MNLSRILLVARTEALEHRRQPWMIFILALNYVVWAVVFLGGVATLAVTAKSPETLALVEQQAAALGICDGESAIDALLRLANSTFGALFFTNLPLFVAIMSGYSVLHDRTTNALPFLMLAPLSRYQLLLGKLLGALAVPFALHLVGVGTVTAIARQIDVITPFADQFGGSAAWWLAYLVGAPASGLLVGSLGTVISALSRDVRTSMQFTSFFIGLLSLGFGFVLFDGIRSGVALQLGFAAAACAAALVVLGVGSRIVSRELRA